MWPKCYVVCRGLDFVTDSVRSNCSVVATRQLCGSVCLLRMYIYQMAWHCTEPSEWKCCLYNSSPEYNNFESEDFVRALQSVRLH